MGGSLQEGDRRGLNYQSIGSGGGIRQIQAKTVAFGATDAPLKGEDLDKHGLVQFPTVLGGVVPVDQRSGSSERRSQADGRGSRRHLPRRDQEVERPEDRGAEQGREAARRNDHAGLPLRLRRARPAFSPPICPRSRRRGRDRSASAPRSTGRSARAARAMKASPRPSSRSPTRSAMSSSPTPSRTTSPTPSCRTRTASSSGRTTRPSRPPPKAPTGTRRRASASR